ncbi:hypothetical protein APASM_2399 [Actinosynnema pretiosum subsp. pretiosum]|nr:hypothetical protein APASM_2399 [Actinosynnema pretiosum subsp. pretiosum]
MGGFGRALRRGSGPGGASGFWLVRAGAARFWRRVRGWGVVRSAERALSGGVGALWENPG